ncbi:hypothetical protein MLD38_029163 [Melastoma candidum]|uniref:Uncharacterized protein n=1 Tax=Melastoma candidum TaxID=119954 RepID=A0ACB9N4U0_9MYRT|nr:hypothetical protein MLD38_029163 [Melastoma candidum]
MNVLHSQNTHRSSVVWESGYALNNVLKCRHHENSVKKIRRDPRMDAYLQQAGFYGVAKLPFIQLDNALITSLVERWRLETHTFHMANGKTTITMQDVAIQQGLPVEGDAVVGYTSMDFHAVCEHLLREAPPRGAMKAGMMKMSWLSSRFDVLHPEASKVLVRMHTRAYILQLIGAMIFPDKSNNLVHLMWLPLLEDFERAGTYSWGSACLAWLYRQLCRASQKNASQVAGCLVLLQTWAWDRFPHLSPIRRRSRQVQGMPLVARWGAALDTKTIASHVLSVIREALDRQIPSRVVGELVFRSSASALSNGISLIEPFVNLEKYNWCLKMLILIKNFIKLTCEESIRIIGHTSTTTSLPCGRIYIITSSLYTGMILRTIKDGT